MTHCTKEKNSNFAAKQHKHTLLRTALEYGLFQTSGHIVLVKYFHKSQLIQSHTLYKLFPLWMKIIREKEKNLPELIKG